MGPRSGGQLEVVFVLASSQNVFFFELAEALGHELTALGVRWRISEAGFPDPASHRVNVILPPHEYHALAADDPGLEDAGVLQRTIGICTEQPNTSHFDENHEIVGRLGRAFDISRFALAETRSRGLDVEHLQLGYTPLLDTYDPRLERDIDIGFVGCSSARRHHMVAMLAPILTRYRCHFAFSDNSRPNGRDAAAATFIWGSAKRRMLQRTRVLLNLHQSDTPYFEWQRAVEAIGAGAVLLTESSAGMAPLIPGRHLVACRPEALAHVIPALLDDEDRLRRIRNEAHRFLEERLPMRAAAEALLRAARALTARPGHRIAGGASLPPLTRVPDDLLSTDTPGPVVVPRSVEGSAIAAALKRLHLDVMDLRRRLPNGSGPTDTRVVYRTAAHRVQDGVEVSSITPLYNQAGFVRAALDSLALAARPHTEVVVVDDGSTDDSFATVIGWLKEHEHVPAVLLAHGRNRGLADARNTAAACARGRFLFVLDSDNTVFPDCLERLAEVLRADPEAAFAYPLIERHGAFGPLGLHPPLGWDPERLRTGNYIDALAMIRRDVLLDLGGYTTDRRLYGWEDYDLWCRVAERGLRGVLVPSVLARYRDSISSMRSIINVDRTDAYAALHERSPHLFAGLPIGSLGAGRVARDPRAIP